MFKSNDYLQDRINEQREAPEEPDEHRSPLPLRDSVDVRPGGGHADSI